MSRTGWFGALGALMFVAATSWYFVSPGYAMMQLKDASVSGDKAALDERIDFARLREGLKSDLKAQMAANAVSEENDGMAALGAALALAMVDPLIDGFVTPEAMAEMVKAGKLKRPGASGSDSGTETEANWVIERDGLSRFVARPEDIGGEEAPGLVFERDGLGWVLVELDIPEGALSSQ